MSTKFEPSRSAAWVEKGVKSSTLLKAISTARNVTKSKFLNRASKIFQSSNLKLVFRYGPTSYRGSLLHRKLKITPYAEHFEKKYPDLRVFYEPTEEYNQIAVMLQDSLVTRCSLSYLSHSKLSIMTSQRFYKQIDEAIKRAFAYPNLMLKPFRDPICMMTHNLEMDYDYPWYRSPVKPFAQYLDAQSAAKKQPTEQKVSFDIGGHHPSNQVSFDLTVGACQVRWDVDRTSQGLWNKFKQKVEESPDFDKLWEIEAPLSEIGKRARKRETYLPASNESDILNIVTS